MTLEEKITLAKEIINLITSHCLTIGDARQISSTVNNAFTKAINNIGENQSISLFKYETSS